MSKLTRREFVAKAAGMGMAALTAGSLARMVLGQEATASNDAQRLNVLFIMTDQQRADTLRCYGNPHAISPSLDALASSGVRFDSCYASQPVCSPCRGSLVTGLYPSAHGVTDNNIPLAAKHFSWMRELHDKGWLTAYIGKWHLSTRPVPDYFDVWHGYETRWPHFIKRARHFAKPGENQGDGLGTRNGDQEAPRAAASNVGRYRPDEETDFAIAFLTANRARPFVCWVSYYPPHTPEIAPKEDVKLFAGRPQSGYFGAVHRIDWNVGRLLKALERLGLRKNTLVVFTSDHGRNFPLRWNKHPKRLCYDQSSRVPLIFSLPGLLAEGKVESRIISSVDLPPTILDLCGQRWPGDLHGSSAKDLIAGNAKGWHEDIYIQNNPYRRGKVRERCVITDRWKLILNTKRPPELYDRRSDHPDTENLYEDVVARKALPDLLERLATWGRKTGDVVTATLVANTRKTL